MSRAIRGPLRFNTKTRYTGTGTIVVGNESLVLVNKTVGAATAVTLPAPSSTGGARVVIIADQKGDAATNNITVTPASGTINGAANHVFSENFAVQMYLDNGTEWITMLPPGVSAVEMGFVNGVTAGTALPSKALVLDANGAVVLPAGGLIDERNAEVVAATNVILGAENGKTFYLNAAGGFTSTLPVPALGLKFKFIVKTAPTTAYIIATNALANLFYGMMEERAGTAGVAGAAQDTFNFVANQAKIGDWVEFESDGTNWYYHGMVDVAAGNTVSAT